jgi:hypothetical protein
MIDLRIESRFKNAALYNAMIAYCLPEERGPGRSFPSPHLSTFAPQNRRHGTGSTGEAGAAVCAAP